MKRAQAVVEATQVLISAEHAIDEAYGETANLAGELVRIRRAANLSAVVGQPAIDEVTAALQMLASARSAMVRAHAGLADVKVRIGCGRIVADGEEKPDFAPGVPLAVVGAV